MPNSPSVDRPLKPSEHRSWGFRLLTVENVVMIVVLLVTGTMAWSNLRHAITESASVGARNASRIELHDAILQDYRRDKAVNDQTLRTLQELVSRGDSRTTVLESDKADRRVWEARMEAKMDKLINAIEENGTPNGSDG